MSDNFYKKEKANMIKYTDQGDTSISGKNIHLAWLALNLANSEDCQGKCCPLELSVMMEMFFHEPNVVIPSPVCVLCT